MVLNLFLKYMFLIKIYFKNKHPTTKKKKEKRKICDLIKIFKSNLFNKNKNILMLYFKTHFSYTF